MKKIYVLSFLLLPLTMLAQRLTTKDGLPHRWVYGAFQDSKGYMWLATYDGLTRYDGNEFLVYRPSTSGQFPSGADRVRQIIEMPGYQFYVSSAYGIFHFDPMEGRFDCLEVASPGRYLIMLAEGIEFPFLQFGGWVPEYKPLSIYWLAKNGQLTPYATIEKTINAQIYPVCINRQEAWFWDFKNQYSRFDFRQKSWTTFTVNPPAGNTAPVDAQGRFYVPDGDSLIAIHLPENTGGLAWQSFSIDPGKVYWLYGKNHQKEYNLLRYDVPSCSWEAAIAGEKLLDLGKSNTLLPFYPSHYQDAEGNMWFTDFSGVLKVQKQQNLFQNYMSLPVVPSETPPVGISARTIWEAPDGSLYLRDEVNKVFKINLKTGEWIRLELPVPKTIPDAIDPADFQLAYGMAGDADGTLWLMTLLGLLHYSPADGHFQLFEMTSRSISIFDDSHGHLWIGDLAIKLFDKKTGALKPIPSLSNISQLYGTMLPEENTFWAFSDTGIVKINTLDYSIQSIKLYKEPRDQRCIVPHRGWLWLGTSRGLEKVDPKTFAHTNFDRSKGLPGTFVFAIVPDGDYLWLGTADGLCRFHTETHEVKNFYVEDGLSQNEFNSLSTLKARDGRIFMGGLNGINAFYPADLVKKKSAPLHINLARFSYFDEKKDSILFIKPSALQREITLAPTATTLSLYLMLDSYLDSKKNQYAWQMEGLDKGWFYAGNQPVAIYRQVPAGTYTFRAKAADAYGNWSSNELAITITVLPFFYQTWWFTFLVLLVVAGIGFAISRYRLQRLLEMERMRTRIASDLHDEVGSMLSGLSMQAELLEMNATEKDRPRIEHIGDISRMAVAKMRDLVWSIDSRRDKVKNLLERMQEQATDLLQPQDISCHFELGELPLEKKLPVDLRQHLFLIFKEALTNITRHSNATEVKVRFGNFDGRFELSIHDNGTLPPKEKVSTGLGLSNMEMRAGKLGAKLEVERNEGFTILLIMKPI